MINESEKRRPETPAAKRDGPPEGLGVRKDMVPDRVFSFEVPPTPVPESEIKEIISTEVLVVGGGISGVAAAASAVESGASAILIEKTNRFASFGGQIAAVDSRLQKKLGVKIDREELILNLVKYGANKPDQRLIRMWVENSGASMDWLLDITDAAGLAVEVQYCPPLTTFDNSKEYYPQYLGTHDFGLGNKVVQTMKKFAEKKGVKIYPFTRALQLYREGKGRVSGLLARNTKGTFIRFNASKAVVLCTGDYSANAEMMAKYCPQAAYLPSIRATSTGDGHQMAMWVGAVMEPAPHAPMSHAFASDIGNLPFLQVNIRGERFQNEDVPGQSYTNAWERQPGKAAFQIFDAKFIEESKNLGIGHGKLVLTEESVKDRMPHILTADTLEELARKMGVPVGKFKATVARYNELARMKKDLDYGKRADRLTTIEQPPFYAGRGRYALIAVMGGLNVNPELQALDKDWEAIPGLYLAGNTMGDRFAVDYPTMVPGISLGMALHFGRVAGRNAAILEK